MAAAPDLQEHFKVSGVLIVIGSEGSLEIIIVDLQWNLLFLRTLCSIQTP